MEDNWQANRRTLNADGMSTHLLFDRFGQKKMARQIKRQTSLTLPRSWSSWRLKNSSGDVDSVKMASSTYDHQDIVDSHSITCTSQVKLKRSSSFRNLMDRFRRYRSTESLAERRRKPQRSPLDVQKVHVQYLQETPGKIVVPVVGLQNHGNSCYINAVLQCLNNTAQMYEFFVSGRYKRDLQRSNRDNAKKYGTNGDLTEACGTLIQSLGRATYTPQISNALIEVVAKYWQQFHDGGEQDAQEFWIWLMEKMHEDLNKKGRRKLKTRKSHKADDVLAAATEGATGSSIISRLFHALFRSSLTCVECAQQSNTFEDFTCLPIPLPQTDIQPFLVNMVFSDAQACIIKYGFTTSVDASVKDLRDLVSQKVFVRPEELLLLELSEEGYQKTLSDDHDSHILQDLEDLFVLQLPNAKVVDQGNSQINIVILHVAVIDDKIRRLSGPRIIQIARDITYAGLELNILSNLEAANGNLKAPQFRIHLVERDEYLNVEDDHPLLTESVDQCLSLTSSLSNFKHLKIYVEWEAKHADMVALKLIREILTEHSSVHEVNVNLPESSSTTTLSDCLDLFMKEETVGMDKQWECPNCHALQIGITKRGTLWTLPEILVIHLKRFRQSSSTRFKLTTMVDFPVSHLDMSGYLTKDADIDWRSRGKNGFSHKASWLPWQKIRKPPESQLNQIHSYSLFGVVNHHGRLNSGHYTACCRHPADGAWYLYDDLRVKTIEETKDIVTKDAYILFYQREPLNTYPGLYYNDYSKTSSSLSIFDMRTPTPRPSRSTDDLPGVMAQEERRKEPELTRTAHIYASLPRLGRRSVLHHPAQSTNGPMLPSSNGHAGGMNNGTEHLYQGDATSAGLYNWRPHPGLEDGKGASHPDDRQGQDPSQPQLIGYQQGPIQESCV